MNPIFAAVAALLPNFTLNPHDIDGRGYFVRDDGMSLFFWPARHDSNKLEISLSLPAVDQHFNLSKFGVRHTVYDKSNNVLQPPSINVSILKSPEKIAKDILTRLVPQSNYVFKLAMEYIEEQREQIKAKRIFSDKMAEVLDVTPGENLQTTDKFHLKLGHGRVTVGYGKVNFEIYSLPADKALKLAEFLNKEIYV